MKKKAIVLGCGRVGQTMVRDLAGDAHIAVTAADFRPDVLNALGKIPGVATRRVDLSDMAALAGAIGDQDVVLGALPSALGFAALRTVIEVGKPYCDISFLPENALELDALAKERGVTAVVDCGVAPGLSNLLTGYAHHVLDRTDYAAICVGGLPKIRHWPYDYKAPFAPSDVVEEYTRPSRVVRGGKTVVLPALCEPELIEFPGVGTLEACITDGLRSLVDTLDIPNMEEKTLRYPGHFELMRVLRHTGFFDKEEIEVGGVKIRPLDMTSQLLFKQWSFAEGEEEFTVMRVVVEGEKGGRQVRYTYDLYDEYDRAAGAASMSRTTAFPNTIMARLVAKGEFRMPGVIPPELAAPHEGLFEHMIAELKARDVQLTERIETIA